MAVRRQPHQLDQEVTCDLSEISPRRAVLLYPHKFFLWQETESQSARGDLISLRIPDPPESPWKLVRIPARGRRCWHSPSFISCAVPPIWQFAWACAKFHHS